MIKNKKKTPPATSIRFPPEVFEAMRDYCDEHRITQTSFIVGLIKEALGFDGFEPPPITKEQRIEALEMRVNAIEERLVTNIPESKPPAFVEPPGREERRDRSSEKLLTKKQAIALALERGLSAAGKTPPDRKFGNAYTDFANGKRKTNPEETWKIKRVNHPDGKGYLYQDLGG